MCTEDGFLEEPADGETAPHAAFAVDQLAPVDGLHAGAEAPLTGAFNEAFLLVIMRSHVANPSCFITACVRAMTVREGTGKSGEIRGGAGAGFPTRGSQIEPGILTPYWVLVECGAR